MERVEIFNHKKISFNRLNRNLVILIIVLACGYFVLQIFVTSIVGTKSEEIDRVRQEEAQLRLENEILTAKIDQAKSLVSTMSFQNSAGLEQKNVNFLQVPDSNNVALQQ